MTTTTDRNDYSCGCSEGAGFKTLSEAELLSLPQTTHPTVHPLLKTGLHPAASDALRAAGFEADDIGQTVGFALASAGTHAPDGRVNGKYYAACTDFHIAGKGEDEVKAILKKLWAAGFAAWYRNPGHDHWPSADARHVHGAFAGVLMKPMVQHQVGDMLQDPSANGLASHADYQFLQTTHEDRLAIRTQFEKNYHID